MTTETRIFRKVTHTVNGLSTYILGLIYDPTLGMGLTTIGYSQVGIRVWKRDEAGTETEITPGSPVAVVDVPLDSGTFPATWDCPQTALASTDAIVVRLYFYSTNWVLQRTWITEQLGAQSLDAATWTVQHFFGPSGESWRHGTSVFPSRIEGFTWTPAAPPPPLGYQYSDGLVSIQH